MLREATASLGSSISELCGANLYLFRDAHQYRLGRAPFLHLQGRTYDGAPHILPLVVREPGFLTAFARESAAVIFPVAGADVESFRILGLEASHNLDDSDYLFRACDLAAYAGPLRKARRNLRKQFRRACNPRDEIFEGRHRADAQTVLDAWLGDVDQPWAQTDYAACKEGLELLEPLGLFGLITYTDAGDPAGFVLASALGDGSAAVHFAKGKRAYPGVFAHLFSRFADLEGQRFPLLNFEQDLGKPGFRQAKRSHGPLRQIHKFRVG